MATSNCTPCTDATSTSAATEIVKAGKYASVLDELNNHYALEPKDDALLHHRSYGNKKVVWSDGSSADRIRLSKLHGIADEHAARLVAIDSSGQVMGFFPNASGSFIPVSQAGDIHWQEQGEANKWFSQGVIGEPQGECTISLAAFSGCDGNGNQELVKLPAQACGYVRPNGVVDNPVPAGSVLMYGGTSANVPDNFLLCDGSAYSSTDYPDLFAAIGYNYGGSGTLFYVPDFRGLFPRGADLGAGVDPDAAGRTAHKSGGNQAENPGSYQDDAIGCHEHSGGGVVVTTSSTTVGSGGSKWITYVKTVTADADTSGISQGSCADVPNTSTETRPANLAINFIISTGC